MTRWLAAAVMVSVFLAIAGGAQAAPRLDTVWDEEGVIDALTVDGERADRIAELSASGERGSAGFGTFLLPPGGATYYVRSTGTDVGDCTTVATACATVQYAIDQHRVAPLADDVVDIGPGTFVGNVDATDPDDDGLQIRGTLSGEARATTLRGDGPGGPSGSAVHVGACGGAEVTLRDVQVDTVGADLDTSAMVIDSDSLLENAHVQNQPGSTAWEVVFSCSGEPTIADSEIVATGDVEGVAFGEGLTLRDSTVTTEDAVAVGQTNPFGGEQVTIERSHLAVASDGPAPVMIVTDDLVLDSSLVTGGMAGILLAAGSDWSVLNSTIDVGEPGVSDLGLLSVLLAPFDDGDLRVNSSLLVEGIDAAFGEGSVTCGHTDLPASPSPDPDWDFDCEHGEDGNTTTDPEDLFVGAGGGYSWQLLAAAPAVDTGDPAAIVGVGGTDLLGNPRVVHGKLTSCPSAAIRDRGAYERVTVTCPTVPVPPTPTPDPVTPRRPLLGKLVRTGKRSVGERKLATGYAFSCPAASSATCHGKVRLYATVRESRRSKLKCALVGSVELAAAPGTRIRIVVSLSAAARAQLERARNRRCVRTIKRTAKPRAHTRIRRVTLALSARTAKLTGKDSKTFAVRLPRG